MTLPMGTKPASVHSAVLEIICSGGPASHIRWLCVCIMEAGKSAAIGEKGCRDLLRCALYITLHAQAIYDALS